MAKKTISYGRRINPKTGQYEYQVGSREFDNYATAKAHYDSEMEKLNKPADVVKIGKDITTVQNTINKLEHDKKSKADEWTKQDEELLALQKQTKKNLVHSTGTIDTTGWDQPLVAPDEGGGFWSGVKDVASSIGSGISSVGSGISSGLKKKQWIDERTRDLSKKYREDQSLVPKGQNVYPYAKKQAMKEWEAKEEDPSSLSNKELYKRAAGGTDTGKVSDTEFDAEYKMYKKDGGKLSKKEYLSYYGLQ